MNKMRSPCLRVIFLLISTSTLFISSAKIFAQQPEIEKPSWKETTHARSAFVIDEALAAVRTNNSVESQIKKRLRTSRKVYILQSKRNSQGQSYCWIAITRRTRGWIDARALAIPGIRSEDERLFNLLKVESNNYDRMQLSHLFLKIFNRSTFIPKVLLILGQTADDESKTLTKHAEHRIKEITQAQNADVKSYYDNDVRLDRYNRIGIIFLYDLEQASYKYNGWAYRQLINHYPSTTEAQQAKELVK